LPDTISPSFKNASTLPENVTAPTIAVKTIAMPVNRGLLGAPAGRVW